MFKLTLTRILYIIILVIFLILFVSLFRLQIVEGAKYEQIAAKNIFRIKTIPPVRGEIFDSQFRPIARNKPSFNLYLTPGLIDDKEVVSEFVSNNFDISSKEMKEIIFNNRFRLHQEILIVQNVTFEKIVKASEKMNYYPSLSYKTEAIRQYQYNNHFTGHIGRINEDEYKKLKKDGYTINSLLGKSGLERYYESILRGKNGKKVIQVDASGQNLNLFKENLDVPPENGADLILTLNNDLQNFVSNIFPKNEKGAVVVMDADNGGILAYVSKPDFDPNIFSTNISTNEWNRILKNPDKPMMDRNIHGTYPPGSTFKPILATLGLETNTIDSKTKLIACDGGLMVGDRYFKCWWEKGHGRLNVSEALKVSCDVFFYDLSLLFSLDQINKYTKQNMLTVRTEIDIPGERKGFIPTHKWYMDNYGKYVPIIGHKVNLSIGQGEVLTTPLQICAYYAALAKNGRWTQPHFLCKSISEKGTEDFIPETKTLPVSAENMQIIKQALWNSVNQRYGTGTAATVAGVDVAGKTGSAENHMGKVTHSWFAGYASNAEFNISYVVFVENAGHGGSISAPIAGQIIDFYNRLDK